jgi:hypothetical protein
MDLFLYWSDITKTKRKLLIKVTYFAKNKASYRGYKYTPVIQTSRNIEQTEEHEINLPGLAENTE